jgi:hypothetical protein
MAVWLCNGQTLVPVRWSKLEQETTLSQWLRASESCRLPWLLVSVLLYWYSSRLVPSEAWTGAILYQFHPWFLLTVRPSSHPTASIDWNSRHGSVFYDTRVSNQRSHHSLQSRRLDIDQKEREEGVCQSV